MLTRPDRSTTRSGGDRASSALVVTRLTKSFGDRHVLRDVSLEIPAGQVVALIGANGAGKSTLLKCLIRLVEPTGGGIRALDRDVLALDRVGLSQYRSKVGVVFQRHNLVPRLSALTNVVHGVQARARGPRTWLQSLARAGVRDEAMSCLASVGLADFAAQRADRLSGGQSQRVAIARMLMQRPELILADEPDASLDPQSGQDVMNLLYELAKSSGLTLIVITHRLEHTLQFSDRIVGLADGRITLDVASKVADATALRSFFEAPDC